MSNPPSSNVVSVHTEDAAPDAPKYRLSALAGHNMATVVVFADSGNVPLRPRAGLHPGAGLYPAGEIEPGDLIPGDLAPSDDLYVAAIRLTRRPSDTAPASLTNPTVGRLGVVCGHTRCGEQGAMPLRVFPAKNNTTRVFTSAMGGGADGDRTIDAYILIEGIGWV